MQEYTIGRYRGELALVFHDSTGKRRRYKLDTVDPREAELRAPALYAELTRPKGTHIGDLWKAYEQDMQGRAIVTTMGYTWRALERRFSHLPVGQVTEADILAHTAERRAAGIRDSTLHTELGHLRMVFRWAFKKKLIDVLPEVPRPSRAPHSEKHLTREHAGALIRAAHLPHIRLYVVLAMGTGARNGAILDLTWDRCDFISGRVNLRNPAITRPHKGRAIVPMNNMVRRELEVAKARALSDYVVEWAGGKVSSVRRALNVSAEKAGVGKVSPHMLRHSAAVHMAEGGIPMEEIAQFLGHNDVNVTRRVYARYSPDYLRGAAAVLEYD